MLRSPLGVRGNHLELSGRALDLDGISKNALPELTLLWLVLPLSNTQKDQRHVRNAEYHLMC